jgi:hypothetical protein
MSAAPANQSRKGGAATPTQRWDTWWTATRDLVNAAAQLGTDEDGHTDLAAVDEHLHALHSRLRAAIDHAVDEWPLPVTDTP